MRRYGTTEIAGIRHVLREFPVSGLLWLAGAVAITGAPPFGLFLSEITILRAGWGSTQAWAAIVMVILLIVIFIGFLNHFRTMYFGDAPAPVPQGHYPGAISVLPMWLALAALLAFGLWWPEAFRDAFAIVARDLGGEK
jgi:hydrogenase-4 component F